MGIQLCLARMDPILWMLPGLAKQHAKIKQAKPVVGVTGKIHFFKMNTIYLAWMPDELSPAHNIVCWGCSVWHRSVEEKLWPITNQSDQSNCQDGLYTMLDRSPVRSSRAAGLPGCGAPGRGAPGRGAAELRAPARGTHGARTWLRGGALPARGGFHSHLETFCTF